MALWLNESDVRALLPLRDLIDCMETALTAFSLGQVRQPDGR
jgi:ornithine cyclodeaminase/alanine dehydrogenase-like protein (mu-crystallin family)